MSAFQTMVAVRETLLQQGVDAIIPELEPDNQSSDDALDFVQYKRNASFEYFRQIRECQTLAVLAVNPDRHQIPNYIGPNTFGELAVAFAHEKRLYTLYGRT